MNQNVEGLHVVKEVIQKLEELQIPYVLGGSLASSIHGKPRFTNDADISVAPFPGREEELLKKLGAEYYVNLSSVKEAVRQRLSFNIIHTSTGFKVDVFVQKERAFETSALERRTIVELEPGIGRLAVLSPEDIILHKLEWFRLGGEISERQWTDVLGVIEVQGDRLDKGYLQTWAQELGLTELLARAEEQARD